MRPTSVYKNDESLKRIFRSLSSAMSARNVTSSGKGLKFQALNDSANNLKKREDSETRFWRSRVCLQKIQEEQRTQSKQNKRTKSISLRSLERERYIAKVSKNSITMQRNMSHEKQPQGLITLQSDSGIIDSNNYNTMSSVKYSFRDNPQTQSTDLREVRLGKQPRNSNNLNTHTYDNTKDLSQKLGFLHPNNTKDAIMNINDSYTLLIDNINPIDNAERK